MDRVGNLALSSSTSAVVRARRTKFTPETRQQIVSLVERGKSREEIAELVGVTVGTLQVTCSKFGISLRRRRFDTGTGSLPLRSSNGTPAGEENVNPTSNGGLLHQSPLQPPPAAQAPIATPGQARAKTFEQDTVSFSLTIQYRGEERTTEIPLTQDMMRQLAIEACLRDMKMGEAVSELIIGVIKGDLFQAVLDRTKS
jgi:transposase-like protein